MIDSDVLLYEIGFSSEKTIDGKVEPASWDFCQDLFDTRVKDICEAVGAKEPPLLFLTNTNRINKLLNKKREYNEEEPKPFRDNFRYEVAKEKEYKSGRSPVKPFHFYNLLNYIMAEYDFHVNENGLEADDAMCIMQYADWKAGGRNTIICSRDKDVRQCPGFHYSWECGKQPEIGPIEVDEVGYLQLKADKKPIKVFGVGDKFFYYQLLVGDAVDAIGGVKNRGPVFAYNLLNDATTSREMYELVAEVYVKTHGDSWKEKFREQADLLWMVRELDENGERVRWTPPKTP